MTRITYSKAGSKVQERLLNLKVLNLTLIVMIHCDIKTIIAGYLLSPHTYTS